VTAEGKAARRRGLGMGLSTLLGGGVDAYASEDKPAASQNVPIEFLRPSPLQPRRRFDEAELEALAQSIRERGILQPLLVRPGTSGAAGYEIVAGERRWRAAQLAGLHEVPAVVRELSDQETLELALIENLQRSDLSALDEARAYRRLTEEFAHTQEAVADAVGKSRSHVANTLRLLALPVMVQELVEAGSLSAGHARALIGIDQAEQLARTIVERGLNVREAEALAGQAANRRGRNEPSTRPKDPNVAELAAQLTRCLGLEVAIRAKRDGGMLTIRYSDLAQLDGLLSRLR
jgi:ParB family transcriptional regulator, chromosome partitioning protein